MDSHKTIGERDQVREWIREQMGTGELPTEPELNLNSHSRAAKSRTWTLAKDDVPAECIDDVEQDAFFGDDSGNESG